MRSPEINYVNAALKIYDNWKVNYQMKDHLKQGQKVVHKSRIFLVRYRRTYVLNHFSINKLSYHFAIP